MTLNLTENEIDVLDHIAMNSYQPTNYSRPETFKETSSIWARFITDSGSERAKPASKSLPGIVASLVKKGLVVSSSIGPARTDDTVELTEAGFNAWQAAVPAPAPVAAAPAPQYRVVVHVEEVAADGTCQNIVGEWEVGKVRFGSAADAVNHGQKVRRAGDKIRQTVSKGRK